jgi:hypothetical protein
VTPGIGRREAFLLRVLARSERERAHRASVETAEEADVARTSADIARELDRAFDGLGAGLAQEHHRGLAHRRERREPLASDVMRSCQ